MRGAHAPSARFEAIPMPQITDPYEVLDRARRAFYGLRDLQMHRELGIVFERDPSGTAAISLLAKPELLGPDGRHQDGSLFTLADVACGVLACDEVWPYATRRGLVAVCFTTRARFRKGEPPTGTIHAETSLISDVEQIFGGESPPRKATVEMAARLHNDDGATAAEFEQELYARFMDQTSADALTAFELPQ
jgi:acyl-coenzyme A thioesterase PaaI-like protein